MIDRINKNEERLDRCLNAIKDLENSITNFNKVLKDVKDLNKYYGSKSWLSDMDKYDKKEIIDIKAGVLSEDGIWNMNESIITLAEEMVELSNKMLDNNIFNQE